jgi:hypothetical protein
MSSENKIVPEDLRPYRKWGLTLLQLMGLLTVTGIVGTFILQYLFY